MGVISALELPLGCSKLAELLAAWWSSFPTEAGER